MPVPARDRAERKAALDEAARARRVRADLKSDLAERRIGLVEALGRRSDPAIANMRVTELIEAVPSYGPVKTAGLMRRIGIAPNRRVRGLGKRQLEELSHAFGDR